MNTSFTKKLLEAHITLAEGGFNTATGQGANTKIIRLGMDVDIQKPGGKEKNKAKVKIFNMPLADMETLTTLAFKPLQASKNRIAVYAGDEEHGMSLAFSGDIVSAVPNFNAAPDPSFDVECITGYVASITPVPPLTAQGAQDVATLMQGLAKQWGSLSSTGACPFPFAMSPSSGARWNRRSSLPTMHVLTSSWMMARWSSPRLRRFAAMTAARRPSGPRKAA